ncbi:MAG: hypothetical protein HY064_01650 [Bacteroidetes bacterium]|nr:hypothetical protein [Bacteroidota bacterium]
MKNIEEKFKNSTQQNFDAVQKTFAQLLQSMRVASNNGYRNIFNSNSWGSNYHKLTIEELFFMNMSDTEILTILNISIYNSVIKKDYSILLDGIFTYSRLRFFSRAYLSGTNDWTAVESLIVGDKELLSLNYPKTLTLENDNYDHFYLISRNLLRTILFNKDWKTQTLQQYSELSNTVSGKFDISFLNYLYGLLTYNHALCKTSFEQMEQLYNKCQWLGRGWYRQADLTKQLPIFLLGAIQLIKYTDSNFEVNIKNDWLKNAEEFIRENKNYKPKLAFEFVDELNFLNEILTASFTSFYSQYRYKIVTEIKNN